ncbi:MAG: hypothetical protein SLAVMIC_00211 [uncultured marine phage]|uniref:Uncharacterized protein n=1 Tax=uncultured marine phage TaxID=707152 RepID=A0A8D9CBP6_9VIRU|nr:MAG: hypothetical protein SLAVMIC_00211 [uncultured marine phage]
MKKVKTKKDIELDKRVDYLELEISGSHKTYWCYLKPPYRYDDNLSAIHEYTIKDICKELNSDRIYTLDKKELNEK